MDNDNNAKKSKKLNRLMPNYLKKLRKENRMKKYSGLKYHIFKLL